MIKFNRVTKLVGRKGHRRCVLRQVDWTIPARSQLALLSVDPSDCTTFLSVISGAQLPTSGWVDRRGTVIHAAWIRKLASGNATPRQIVYNLAKIYRAEARTLMSFVDEYAGLGNLMTVPVRFFPRHLRVRLGVTLIYAIPADFYLFDGKLQLGFPDMKARYFELFAARRSQAGMIISTTQSKVARDFGGEIAILHEGSVYLADHPEDAIAAFDVLLAEYRKNNMHKDALVETPNTEPSTDSDATDFLL